MIEMTKTNPSAGRISGSVTDQNRRGPPAPSMRAASYRSSGTPCIAASSTAAANGTLFQILTRHSDTSAQPGSISQRTGPRPNQPSTVLNRPPSVLNMKPHTMVMAAVEATSGRNSTLRNNPIPLTFAFNAAATARLTTIVGTSVAAVKITVFASAR